LVNFNKSKMWMMPSLFPWTMYISLYVHWVCSLTKKQLVLNRRIFLFLKNEKRMKRHGKNRLGVYYICTIKSNLLRSRE
jgi:hypothetical protein